SPATSPCLGQFSERGGQQALSAVNCQDASHCQLARTAAGDVIRGMPGPRHTKPMQQGNRYLTTGRMGMRIVKNSVITLAAAAALLGGIAQSFGAFAGPD